MHAVIGEPVLDSNTEQGVDFDNLTTDIATRLRSNESVFESTRNISINDKSNNDKYVKKVKTQINENKQFLKKSEKLMNFYLRKVISSREKRLKILKYIVLIVQKKRGEP